MSVWFGLVDSKRQSNETKREKLRLELGELYLEKHFWWLSLPNRTRRGVLPNRARRGAWLVQGGFKMQEKEKKREGAAARLTGSKERTNKNAEQKQKTWHAKQKRGGNEKELIRVKIV